MMLSSVEPIVSERSTVAEIVAATHAEIYSLKVLRGLKAVTEAAPAITQLRLRTGQHANPLLVPEFFVGRVQLFPGNQPVVLLVFHGERLEGAVYLYEKTICGLATGYLRGFDHLTGESSVIGRELIRAQLLQFAIHQLFLQTRVRVAWATVSEGAAHFSAGSLVAQKQMRVESGSMLRAHRLKLNSTFDATLSRFGQHTRRNLRYYRRRAEKELQAVFHPQLSLVEGDQALQQLGKSSFQPFPVSLSEWQKMDGLVQNQPGYFAMGLQSHGEWLSYLVGLRASNLTYVLMQVNHNRFARYSLSTVLRSYLFEHEIQRGQAEIRFVNGTCAFFQRCCELDSCRTVSAHRGLTAFVLLNWIAPWHSAPDHALNMKRWTRDLDLVSTEHGEAGMHTLLPSQPKG